MTWESNYQEAEIENSIWIRTSMLMTVCGGYRREIERKGFEERKLERSTSSESNSVEASTK